MPRMAWGHSEEAHRTYKVQGISQKSRDTDKQNKNEKNCAEWNEVTNWWILQAYNVASILILRWIK